MCNILTTSVITEGEEPKMLLCLMVSLYTGGWLDVSCPISEKDVCDQEVITWLPMRAAVFMDNSAASFNCHRRMDKLATAHTSMLREYEHVLLANVMPLHDATPDIVSCHTQTASNKAKK